MSRIRAELAAAMLFAAAATASAATITVTTGADDVANPPAGSLRAAAAAAQPGDVIEIAAGVTVELAGDLDLGSTANLTVRAAQAGTARVSPDVEVVDPGVQLRMLAHMSGVTFQDLTIVHLGLELGNASNVQVRSCSFVHNRASVRVIGSDHVVLEKNSFQGCSDGVLSKGSSDVAIRDCRFTECGYGVNSEDDAALEITRCTMRGMTGVEIHGSAGTVEGNDFVAQSEGEREEIAIFVGLSQKPQSMGPLRLSGNRIRLSGARGILVFSRSDVTIEHNEIAGRGAGLGISVGPRSGSPDGPTVTDNTVTGAFFGIVVDCEDADGSAVTLRDNTVSRADQGITFVGNRTSSCTIEGSRVSACRNGIVVTGSGAVAGVFDTTVRGCGVAGLSVGEETIVHATDLVARQNRDGIAVAPRAYLRFGGAARFDGNRLAGVFADVTAHVLLDDDARVGMTRPPTPNPKQPLFDIAPRGAVTPGFTATLFGNTLSVAGTAGAGGRAVWLFGPDRNYSTFQFMDTQGHASFDVTGRVAGTYEVRVVGTYSPGLPQLPGSFSRIEASVWVRLP